MQQGMGQQGEVPGRSHLEVLQSIVSLSPPSPAFAGYHEAWLNAQLADLPSLSERQGLLTAMTSALPEAGSALNRFPSSSAQRKATNDAVLARRKTALLVMMLTVEGQIVVCLNDLKKQLAASPCP